MILNIFKFCECFVSLWKCQQEKSQQAEVLLRSLNRIVDVIEFSLDYINSSSYLLNSFLYQAYRTNKAWGVSKHELEKKEQLLAAEMENSKRLLGLLKDSEHVKTRSKRNK